jgi:chemotaxis protein methyltransferase WspC
MAPGDFSGLLKTTIGLDAASIGASCIERAIQERLVACGLDDRHAYWDHVSTRDGELQAFIEAVVVPETWFFRDPEAFAALARIAREESLRLPSPRVLRLLSLPSSTGEEPYAMAMALLDAGVPADRFRIDAADISGRSLARARRAVYGRNSFRGRDLSFRDRHFAATPGGYQLDDAVRRQVDFHQANLFDSRLTQWDAYDLVFCRNLLIYFDRPTQDRAIGVLARLLASNGTLFVAASETGLLLNHNFVSARLPLAFAFRPSGARPVTPTPTPAPLGRPAHRRRTPARSTTLLPPPLPVRSAAVADAAPIPSSGPPPSLEPAKRLADEGHFAEAASYCEEHLRRHGPSAEAFHLMGLVRDACGNHAEASEYYRKALYLDPDHHDALVHFALLVERTGNASRAEALRNRARRLEATESQR